jgi:nicotinamide-nucleotide amidase
VKIEILTVGTELLNGRKSDAHGPWLGLQLNELGLAPRFSGSVADDISDIEMALHTALERSDLVLVCGGLGPTLDDVTREAVAAVAQCPLSEDTSARATLEALFTSKGRTMTPNNLRQAQVPEGAAVLPNPVGTAPGLRVVCKGQHAGRTLILLPGPPHELRKVFLDSVLPWLKELSKAPQRYVKVLNCWGLGESAVDQALEGLVEKGDSRSLAMLAHGNYVELRLSSTDPKRVEALEAGVLERLGDFVFSTEGKLLEEVLASLLSSRGASLAIAESCTGGRIAAKLTAVPGASKFLVAGLVTYADDAKTKLLEVPPFVLKKAGAVSRDTALAMAVGLARRFGTDYNLSVTGIAGPDGGSAEKPVGLVYFAVAGPEGVVTQEFRFGGAASPASRQDIQARAAQAGLFLLYRVLSDLPVSPEDSDRAALPVDSNPR